jgi:hypothetical protein
VREFAAENETGIVAKMLRAPVIRGPAGLQGVFTTALTPQDLSDLDGLRLCPMVFQERIEKRLELRVTVVGQRVFTAALDSQQIAGAESDWRQNPAAVARAWQSYTLPRDVARMVSALMDRLRLNYGAADFILTPNGRYVFLEINPGGQFGWLETELGLPISEAIADVLVDSSARRSGNVPLRWSSNSARSMWCR